MTLSRNIMPGIQRQSARPRSVALLAYEGQCLFEFATALELLGDRSDLFGDDWYRLCVCALEPQPLRSDFGLIIEAAGSVETLLSSEMVIVAGWRMTEAPEILCDVLRQAHEAGARIVSICTGSFLLAAAGLLDGRRATTHWLHADELAKAYPRVEVDADALYVDEGDIVTSAGSTAGIDMLLHLIRRDYGVACSNAVARGMVSPPHREGGQAQFIERSVLGPPDAPLGHLLDFVRANLAEQHQVEDLARHAGMSPRTFFRRFKGLTGMSPYEWLLKERLRAARDLLESTELSIDQIAFRTGFGAADTLRHHFQRVVRTTPSEYRRTFQNAAAA